MADVTVGKLAEAVKIDLDRLLKQMADAGLPQKKESDTVSDEEKQKLLAHLKTSHGSKEGGEPRKITLKRKTLSTLKAPSAAGKKTVNIEVRKKRTYVKKDDADLKAQEELEAKRLEEEAVEAEAKAKAEAVAEAEAHEATLVAAEEAAVAAVASSGVDDFEAKRQAGMLARKAAEKELQIKITARKAEIAEAAAAKKAEAEKKAAATPTTTAKKSADEPKLGRRLRGADAAPGGGENDSKPRKKSSRGRGSNDAAKMDRLHMYRLAAIDDDDEGRTGVRMGHSNIDLKFNNKHTFARPAEAKTNEVEIPENISVSDLAKQMGVKAGSLVKQLMKMGVMASMNETIDQDTAQLLVEELGHTFKLVTITTVEEELTKAVKADEGTQESRAPVVTVMGHVDHGKTSLLDYIRKAKVTDGEAGGITQHIGAYQVQTDKGEITFLDTPGHAAFTAMRSRGAECTDVVILVVAADDGVMPQTKEAVQHAKAAGVPLVVAVNKIDKQGADPEKVKTELSALEVMPEDWGGDVQFIPVSAHTGEGIDKLLDAVLIQSEMLELSAARNIPASGVVVEARIEKGRGAVATVLVQSGTLKKGDILLAGSYFGRVRAMINDSGKTIDEAGPSTAIEVLGLANAPDAGDDILVVPSEKRAREVAEFRKQKIQDGRQARHKTVTLENLFSEAGDNQKNILPVFIKTDVRGSLGAITSALEEMGNDEVEVKIIGSGVGGITQSDVNLALASKAIVIGFNVRAESAAKKISEAEGVEIRYYSIIYNLLDEIKQSLSGLLAPERVEEIVGIADVRDVFSSPKFGQVAGCMVIEGSVLRNKPIRVLRDNVVIHEGELDSLRRFKDDVNEVRNGTECGIGVKNYDVKVGDQIEVFDVKEVARSL